MKNKTKNSFLNNNSLSIAFLSLAEITIMAQAISGLSEYTNFLNEHHQSSVGVFQYLTSGQFIEASVWQ